MSLKIAYANLETLPVIPKPIRRAFMVDERFDLRFTACARLLQSIWRSDRDMVAGKHRPRKGQKRRLGSRLSSEDAQAGHAFLTADIARFVMQQLAYREVGALYDEERLWGNLLSSQALAFNLFAPMAINLELASAVFSRLAPNIIEKVGSVRFEYSPGRNSVEFLGDQTAFDVMIEGNGPDGEPAILAIEVKYAEQSAGTYKPNGKLFHNHVLELDMHHGAGEHMLTDSLTGQFIAEHILTRLMRDRRSQATKAAFMVIAPHGNTFVRERCRLYESILKPQDGHGVPFLPLSLEGCIDVIGASGGGEFAERLRERYTDFTPIHLLIEGWTPFKSRGSGQDC